ncbi:MAG: pantetheine-phosphate adenylyltransferase [Phycisphaeraceae bacterium]|nr:pantetheine-phosphate adenylyltransferase [Phycisphaeraceae bacterium]
MTHVEKIGLFPGTFDPITNGHLDVIRRGQGMFDQLIVAIADNPAKPQVFSMQERRDMIEQLIRESFDDHVSVQCFHGLTVDFARQIGATAILRGLRNVTDLNFEFQLALTNRAVANIETVFVMSDEAFGFTSSTLIKQIAAGGEIDRLHRMLPQVVIDALKRKKIAFGGTLPWSHVDHFKE